MLIPASSSSGGKVRADGRTIGSIVANNTKGTVEISDDGAIIDPGRGEGAVNGDAAGEGEGDSQEEDDGDNHPTRIRMPSGAWMPYDVMVGVSIGGGHGSSGRRFWGLRGSGDAGDGRKLADGDGGGEGDENSEGSEERGGGEEVGKADGGGAGAAAAGVGGTSSEMAANGTT